MTITKILKQMAHSNKHNWDEMLDKSVWPIEQQSEPS